MKARGEKWQWLGRETQTCNMANGLPCSNQLSHWVIWQLSGRVWNSRLLVYCMGGKWTGLSACMHVTYMSPMQGDYHIAHIAKRNELCAVGLHLLERVQPLCCELGTHWFTWYDYVHYGYYLSLNKWSCYLKVHCTAVTWLHVSSPEVGCLTIYTCTHTN